MTDPTFLEPRTVKDRVDGVESEEVQEHERRAREWKVSCSKV